MSALGLDTKKAGKGRPSKAGYRHLRTVGEDSKAGVLEADEVQCELELDLHSVVMKMEETKRNNEFNQ